ncbi:isoleucine--tRNA ligase [Sandaracinobacteroides saxicola]|uniref:Isoleucine--tRNA ligase n=1 Tax=Sandaracinobacteroides saxicola TaxID=2759707 RepID=A0A7G5ILD5_9SPHN|nr:isoleucine--tRNA ligase [Sandaracinobacteroides saxicola]QMW24177.1 isoleucine--tRNA ligase [Sandaracinobacteroides saxicola]
MTETVSAAADYRQTVFLPKTDFPMKAGLAASEPARLARWLAGDLYGSIRRARADAPKWIFHDGPPYANGDMHLGHAMNHTLKDLACRTHGMLGFDAPYIPGWDCHGLPIEWKVEEGYRAKGRKKEEVDFLSFRAECRAYAAHWVGVQREQLKRLGVLADWDEPYLTMDFGSEAVIAAELMKFATSGQVYRGAKPVMWSPVEQTALAEAEIEYEDVVSTQIDVAFEIVEAPNYPDLLKHGPVYAVIWTTTPWTIPANRALAYGADVEYSLCYLAGLSASGWSGDTAVNASLTAALDDRMAALDQWGNKFWICATELIPQLEARITERGIRGSIRVKQRLPKDALKGGIAHHPLHHLSGFFAERRPLLAGDFVTTDAGTGLVHMAPDHGEDDFALCKAHGIDPVFAVQADGTYADRADWAWLAGKGSVISPKLNAPDGPICSALREAGALLSAGEYRHSYPHSWRSKKKVIYRCTPQWFVAMDRPLAPSAAADAASRSPVPGESLHGSTLRELALAAIDATRWVPAGGYNRIRAMVEGRPDWVLSRQRAWGVPITLFVHRESGEYLRDPAVNARIVAAFKEQGADAWWTVPAQAFLGADHDAADYEQVTDILDVWFDSGSTHAFVVEARHGVAQADLYLEGSDQHRGWFQSSLLEACGTRGRAPYKTVVTHGMALDGQGRKMSKSLGNVIDPVKIIDVHGADVLRLWVASVDYQEDVRLSDEILKGVVETYRKLRNTLRYLLGALDGFTDAERVAHGDMPPLERWVLHRLAVLDGEIRADVADFAFNRMTARLAAFCNTELSSLFFDIRKDSLYCDPADSAKRRAYRTVLDTLFHALVHYLAPVMVFTAEEAWATRYPDAPSVHQGVYPAVDAAWIDEGLAARFATFEALRAQLALVLEPMRQGKVIRSFLEAEVTLPVPEALADLDLAELLLVARVNAGPLRSPAASRSPVPGESPAGISATVTDDPKCARCWRHLPDVAPETQLCTRCAEAVA